MDFLGPMKLLYPRITSVYSWCQNRRGFLCMKWTIRISAKTIHPPQRCVMATHHSNLEALSAAEGSTTSGKKSTKEMPKLKLLSCGYSSPEDEFRDVVELSMEKNS